MSLRPVENGFRPLRTASGVIDMPDILAEIIKHKEKELSLLKGKYPAGELERKARSLRPARDFFSAVKQGGVNIIAEVKKASPSKGVIREDFDPVAIARIYEENGASAISVLTDEKYFMGSMDNLRRIREAVSLSVLRKDFIIDPYQVYESRAAGADALLLIAAVLDGELLKELLSLTRSLGMEAVVEVHTEDELKAALEAGAKIIGVNNRDLSTFKTDISTTVRLSGKIPPEKRKGIALVSESGINSHADIKRLMEAGVDSFLIGEALMRERDIGKKLRELKGAS